MPAARPSSVMPSRRVAIVSGSFGAGHDAAAREVAIRLAEQGIESVQLDVVAVFPGGLGPAVRRLYYAQLRRWPRTWGWLLSGLDDAQPSGGGPAHDRTATRLALWLVAILGAGLRKHVSTCDAVIATHPFAAQSLGRLRRTGALQVPAITYLTDLSVHRLWVGDGVDAHLALHKVAAEQARAHGAQAVHVVRPAVSRSVIDAASGSPATPDQWDLPTDRPLCLVTGGAEGIGELAQSALDIAATGVAHPVVLCGRDATLKARLSGRSDLTALGWISDMARLYACVDLLVQNAGGSISLEGLAAGLAVISYRCLPGHGQTNAAALDTAGLARWVHDREDLAPALVAALGGQQSAAPHNPAIDALRDAPCVGAVIAGLLPAR